MGPTESEGTHDLPDVVARILRELVESARDSLGNTLHSVVLFGSAAENRLRPTSDVNVMLVVTRFDASHSHADGRTSCS